jgi:hypothetical protein
MRGHVRKRGEPGSWEYIVDVGLAAAQRCTVCSRRLWIERRPQAKCPKYGGSLTETEERRRETKSGFATQKECQAAMNKLLVAVEQHNYSAPTKASVKDYLKKEWLPAVKATIRPSTYNSYVQHVDCHIVPHIGTVKLQKLSGSQVNALYAKLAETGRKNGKSGLSSITSTAACTRPARTRSGGGTSRGTRWMPPTRRARRATARRRCGPGRRSSSRHSLRPWRTSASPRSGTRSP